MKIFITGASGYIGGSVAAAWMAAGHSVSGLARSADSAAALQKIGIEPVRGSLDDADTLAAAARAADVTVNAASADHRAAVEAILGALKGTRQNFSAHLGLQHRRHAGARRIGRAGVRRGHAVYADRRRAPRASRSTRRSAPPPAAACARS